MNLMRFFSRGLGFALVALAMPPLALPARAQAWVPPTGEATVAIVFQDAFVKNHYFGTVRSDRGHITSNSLTIDTSFGLTRKFALDVALPYVMAKYNGPSPHPTAFANGTLVDNGQFHGTPQDFRFAARYNVKADGLVVTPFVALSLPSHDYTFYAHSAPGVGLREVQVGAYVATLLDRIVPGAFVQARYSYGFLEEVLSIPHNRSNADLEIGYFVTPSFRAFALGSAQLTHGGIDTPYPGRQPALTGEYLYRHDQIGRFNHLNVGGGASLSLSDSMDVFGSFTRTVAARNGHELNRAITVGVSFSVTRARSKQAIAAPPPPVPDTTTAQQRTLIRCVCQKGT